MLKPAPLGSAVPKAVFESFGLLNDANKLHIHLWLDRKVYESERGRQEANKASAQSWNIQSAELQRYDPPSPVLSPCLLLCLLLRLSLSLFSSMTFSWSQNFGDNSDSHGKIRAPPLLRPALRVRWVGQILGNFLVNEVKFWANFVQITIEFWKIMGEFDANVGKFCSNKFIFISYLFLIFSLQRSLELAAITIGGSELSAL